MVDGGLVTHSVNVNGSGAGGGWEGKIISLNCCKWAQINRTNFVLVLSYPRVECGLIGGHRGERGAGESLHSSFILHPSSHRFPAAEGNDPADQVHSGLKRLAIARFWWDAPLMTVTADAKKRVVLPPAKPGDRFDVQLSTNGKLVLTPLIPDERFNKVKLVKKHGYTVAVTSRPITQAQTRAYMDEFP